jgi:hypothetical protein
VTSVPTPPTEPVPVTPVFTSSTGRDLRHNPDLDDLFGEPTTTNPPVLPTSELKDLVDDFLARQAASTGVPASIPAAQPASTPVQQPQTSPTALPPPALPPLTAVPIQQTPQGQQPPPLPPPVSALPPPLPFDPLAAAEEAMRKEERQRQADEARRTIDPEFDQRKREEEQRKQEAEDRKGREGYHYAADAMGRMGIPGAGIVSSLATANPLMVGMAIADAVKNALSEITAFGSRGAQATMNFDAMGLQRGFGDLASNIPIVGGLFGGLINATANLSDAMLDTARRLSSYSSELAAGVAQLDVDRIMRDIERARTHGPDILAAVERRREYEDRMEQVWEKLMPIVLDFLSSMTDMLENQGPAIATTLRAFLVILLAIAEAIGTVLTWLGLGVGRLASIDDSVRPVRSEPPFLADVMGLVAPPGTVAARDGRGSMGIGAPSFGR